MSLAERVLASSVEPHTDNLGRVPAWSDYTVSADLDNQWRWVVEYRPTIAPDCPDGADARTRFLARRVARERSLNLRAVAGAVEQGTDMVSWYASRPHRGAAGGSRCFKVYPFADWAVAEICRRDRAYRKKGR